MSETPWLSVVVPFRDEAPSLVALHGELRAALDPLGRAIELLFVDDASRDEGPAILETLAAGDPRIRLLRLTPHSGQSAALEAGFRAARGEVVATLDADGQNDPADLPRLLAALDEADCVCGVRVDRQDPRSTRIASRVANAVRGRVLGDGLRDIGCALRVMRAAPLARIRLFRGGHRFLPSMLRMEGARVVELPVAHRPRRHGTSRYGIASRLAVVWIDLLGMVWWARRVQRYEVKESVRRVDE
ncbi:MAG: glycosyltransferase family 2 protein [Myxococcota bacterium]